MLRHLNTKIDSKSMIEVEKITPALIKEAINKLKNDKTDPLYYFNSACMNASPILSEHLAKLFRMHMTHGHLSSVILVSTIIPLIKDKLGDISSSNNYRSVALSSLCYFTVTNSVRMSSNLATNKIHRKICARGWS